MKLKRIGFFSVLCRLSLLAMALCLSKPALANPLPAGAPSAVIYAPPGTVTTINYFSVVPHPTLGASNGAVFSHGTAYVTNPQLASSMGLTPGTTNIAVIDPRTGVVQLVNGKPPTGSLPGVGGGRAIVVPQGSSVQVSGGQVTGVNTPSSATGGARSVGVSGTVGIILVPAIVGTGVIDYFHHGHFLWNAPGFDLLFQNDSGTALSQHRVSLSCSVEPAHRPKACRDQFASYVTGARWRVDSSLDVTCAILWKEQDGNPDYFVGNTWWEDGAFWSAECDRAVDRCRRLTAETCPCPEGAVTTGYDCVMAVTAGTGEGSIF